MALRPVEIKREGIGGITITWSDNLTQTLSSKELRTNCPCATCRELRGDQSHGAPLTSKKSSLRVIQASAAEELSLENIWAVGQYALGIKWADGHDSGIYTYEYLRSLGSQA